MRSWHLSTIKTPASDVDAGRVTTALISYTNRYSTVAAEYRMLFKTSNRIVHPMPWLNRLQMSVLSMIASILLVSLAVACVTEDDLTSDQRVHQLSQQLMCPVCDGQTLDQSQAQLSEDMKAVIRDRIEAGDTNEEIREYFVERYGEIVLASPDASGFNMIAWIMPAVIFIGGSLLVAHAFINMRRRRRTATDGSAQDASPADTVTTADKDAAPMDEYLERANREIDSVIHDAPDVPDSGVKSEDRT